MVIQEDLAMIVMLCNLRENQRAQCEQYWPKNVGDSIVFGNIQVNLLSQDDLGNNIIKRVVKVNSELEEKTVIQIQWCGWPDQGVPSPSDFDVMRELLNMINEKLQQDQKVVFHCSAGVGRTGIVSSIILYYLFIVFLMEDQQIFVFIYLIFSKFKQRLIIR